jgi:dTDP-4-amino-4,6-dideoxygalactose transaminase
MVKNFCWSYRVKTGRELKQIQKLLEQVYWDDVWSLGKMTARFETQAKAILFQGQREVLMVNSGSTALELALRGILHRKVRSEKPKVIMPVLTVPMVKWAIERTGCEPVMVDCGYTHNMERNFFVQAVQQTKPFAVIWVYTGGLMPDFMREVRQICDENGIFLIEDISQAHLSRSKNEEWAGTIGHLVAGSMAAPKVLNCGEGGFVAFEPNSELEDILRRYRNQGKKEGSDHFAWDGFNYRPNEFTAAVALVRLLNLHREIRKRKRIASFYNARLANFTPALKVKHLEMKCRPSFYRYVVGVHDDGFGRTPTEIIDRLRRMKAPLEGLVHDYPLRSGYPLAEKVAKTHICLPLDSEEKAERWVKLAEYVLRN